jgi:hypothetical protein
MDELVLLNKVLIRAALFGICYWGIDHGTSATFELGLISGGIGLFHWIFWGNK